MKLYRIMLVDDEEEVRKGIIRKIHWEDTGFEVVGDAENGEEALEKIEILEPDVIMTDIRMPFMDGLTLTEKIHQKYPSMKVLIFSGYDDFEYAQKAIKLNVTEYILKPVNVEELTAILKKIKTTLDEDIAQKRNVNLLRESYKNSLPIIREHYMNDLIRGNVEAEWIEKQLENYGVSINDAKKWVVAVVDVETEEASLEDTGKSLSLHHEKELIPISVNRLLHDSLEHYCRFVTFTYSSMTVIIAAIDDYNTQTGLIEQLSDVCKDVRRVLEIKITIGIGVSCSELKNISKSFDSAMNALGYKAIVGTGQTIYINDVEPVSRGKLQFDAKDESELTALIKFGKPEKLEEGIRKITDKMYEAKVHYRQQQVYIIGIVNCITTLCQQYDLDLNQILDSEDDYFKLIDAKQKREDFQHWLSMVVQRMNSDLNQERDNTTKNIIREAKEYIMENYMDAEMSVEKICRHLHMSPAYFSTVFKKETGQAYITYLTDVRLSKAVELLNSTDDKTYIIASKVGYQEQNYFSYVFKKKFGVSPTKYRDKG